MLPINASPLSTCPLLSTNALRGYRCPGGKRTTARYHHRLPVSVRDKHRGGGYSETTRHLHPWKRCHGGTPAILSHGQPLQERVSEPGSWVLLQVKAGASCLTVVPWFFVSVRCLFEVERMCDVGSNTHCREVSRYGVPTHFAEDCSNPVCRCWTRGSHRKPERASCMYLSTMKVMVPAHIHPTVERLWRQLCLSLNKTHNARRAFSHTIYRACENARVPSIMIHITYHA